MERYGVSLRIQSEYGKMRTRITPNTDTFYAVRTNENSLAQGRNFWRLLYSKVLIFSYYEALIKQLLTYCHQVSPLPQESIGKLLNSNITWLKRMVDVLVTLSFLLLFAGSCFEKETFNKSYKRAYIQLQNILKVNCYNTVKN